MPSLTQPAVTFQVRQLEDHFGTRLFDRKHNRIELTRAGQRVLEYCDRILALYVEMDASVRELTDSMSGQSAETSKLNSPSPQASSSGSRSCQVWALKLAP